jgi:hypothetical protein
MKSQLEDHNVTIAPRSTDGKPEPIGSQTIETTLGRPAAPSNVK